MRALLFAAGRGERMRPLTDTTPKPLLTVDGKPLIQWHIERLAMAGIRDIVINTAYLAAQFPATLGDGDRFGLRIRYAYEGATALETGGGMLHALPLLGDAPFIVVSSDVWTDFDFARLPRTLPGTAHLVLVDNPPHHADGDFALDATGCVGAVGPRLTWSGIGVFTPRFLADWREAVGALPDAADQPPRFKLRSVLEQQISAGNVSAEHYRGTWSDVGTPARLAALAAAAPRGSLADGPHRYTR